MKRNIILLFFTVLSFNTFAQEAEIIEKQTAEEVQTVKQRDWYIELGAGAQMLFSSDANKLTFADRLTPSLSLTLGKWLTDTYGLRLQIGGYALNGYSTYQGLYVADPQNGAFGNNDPVREHISVKPDGSYPHYVRYINPHADFQVSVPHLFCEKGWGKWDLIPAVGLGYFGTFDYKGVPQVNSLSANFALMGKYNVYDRWDINLEVSTAVLPGSFDGRITGKLIENTLSATLGVSYHLSYKEKKVIEPQETGVVAFTPQAVPQIIHDTVFVDKIVEKEIRTLPDTLRLSSILFKISQTKPVSGQEIQFHNIADFVKQMPDIKLLIEGYSDKETGTDEINQKISEKRAESVRTLLIEKYGVAADRIETKGNGAALQPYPDKKMNRVATISVVK
ncbi:MAG: OmpA family protein [Prevotellaceae bacterium]|jgi:outer membrane protein OmpA-like peptidoglycan-associated protein|nr:OmpA family protein [Prevotellaceae bacterium]